MSEPTTPLDTTADLNYAELQATPEPTVEPIQDDFVPTNVAQDEGYAAVKHAILARVLHHFEPVGVPADFTVQFAHALAENVEKTLVKFARGHLEHGGDIRDRDLIDEIEQEVTDLQNYIISLRLQKAYIKLTF